MNELIQKRSHIHASIVKSPLATHDIARNINELTLERSHIRASIVKKCSVGHQVARNMKKLTQEKSRIHASIVKSPLVSHHTVRNMKRDMQDPALLKQKQHDQCLKSRRDLQESAATLGGEKCCVLFSLSEEVKKIQAKFKI